MVITLVTVAESPSGMVRAGACPRMEADRSRQLNLEGRPPRILRFQGQ
jgi:hypothetical protein